MRLWISLVRGMILVLLAQPSVTSAEEPWQFGGFFEGMAQGYRRRPHDADARAFVMGHWQPWGQVILSQRLSGRVSLDVWANTHHELDGDRWLDIDQRGLRRPVGALRELYLDAKLGPVDLRLGKQQIRWGRTDTFNPTDNVTPSDYLNIAAHERLPVPAAKADVYVAGARFEAVWAPRFIPTRLPLLHQRWFPRLPASAKVPTGPLGQVVDAARLTRFLSTLLPFLDPAWVSRLPGSFEAPPGSLGEEVEVELAFDEGGVSLPAFSLDNGQWGLRWNQRVPQAEFSVSYFDGFDAIASFRPTTMILRGLPRPRVLVRLNREYRRVRVVGADFASGWGPLGIRGEVAYFAQDDPARRDRVAFAAGLDRTWGDWLALVEYVDQIPTSRRPATDRPGATGGAPVFPNEGLRSMILYRIERTISPSQSVELKGAIGTRHGDTLVQLLYNRAVTDRLRLKLGGVLFAGPRTAYLGQYRDNGYVSVELRYTF